SRTPCCYRGGKPVVVVAVARTWGFATTQSRASTPDKLPSRRSCKSPPRFASEDVRFTRRNRALAINHAKLALVGFVSSGLDAFQGHVMTFEELDARFPNGFGDAEISSVSLDYKSRTATLQLNLRVNPPDSPNSQEYRRGVLTI